MEPLRIYRVDDKYIKYLHSRDFRVQYNKDARRPYVGVVLRVGHFSYFVPMESPKPNHANIKNGKHIFRLEHGKYGLLGFNNMIPVPRDALIEFDIAAEPDEQYKRLLQHQADICNRKKADIVDHANSTYIEVISKENAFLTKISCDFKALEHACRRYNPNYKPKTKS